MTRAPAAVALTVSVGLLASWLQPLRTHDADDLPARAAVAIERGRLHPEFLRVGPGGCATVANLDSVRYQTGEALGAPWIEPGELQSVCFERRGVHRLPVDGEPFHGGFVIVDPSIAPEEVSE